MYSTTNCTFLFFFTPSFSNCYVYKCTQLILDTYVYQLLLMEQLFYQQLFLNIINNRLNCIFLFGQRMKFMCIINQRGRSENLIFLRVRLIFIDFFSDTKRNLYLYIFNNLIVSCRCSLRWMWIVPVEGTIFFIHHISTTPLPFYFLDILTLCHLILPLG